MLNRINPSFLAYREGKTEFLTIEPKIEQNETENIENLSTTMGSQRVQV